MTREEAYNIDILTRTGLNTRIVVDKIFKDFESRTCENCKHFEYEDRTGGIGLCLDFKYQKNIIVDDDFGCNKFERKTDGNV